MLLTSNMKLPIKSEWYVKPVIKGSPSKSEKCLVTSLPFRPQIGTAIHFPLHAETRAQAVLARSRRFLRCQAVETLHLSRGGLSGILISGCNGMSG